MRLEISLPDNRSIGAFVLDKVDARVDTSEFVVLRTTCFRCTLGSRARGSHTLLHEDNTSSR